MNDEFSHLEPEMNRGFLQVLTLVVLDKARYGYQMVKYLETQGYSVEENTLYPLLRRLEKNKYIKSQWDVGEGRPKKFYEITQLGTQVRERLLAIRREQENTLKNLLEKKDV